MQEHIEIGTILDVDFMIISDGTLPPEALSWELDLALQHTPKTSHPCCFIYQEGNDKWLIGIHQTGHSFKAEIQTINTNKLLPTAAQTALCQTLPNIQLTAQTSLFKASSNLFKHQADNDTSPKMRALLDELRTLQAPKPRTF